MPSRPGSWLRVIVRVRGSCPFIFITSLYKETLQCQEQNLACPFLRFHGHLKMKREKGNDPGWVATTALIHLYFRDKDCRFFLSFLLKIFTKKKYIYIRKLSSKELVSTFISTNNFIQVSLLWWREWRRKKNKVYYRIILAPRCKIY